jgi:hypothetical protein
MHRNGGHLIYAIDDTYIHMAMAKNLATHGVWGVTRYEFTSSSSSPLWTLLLALVYRVLGVNDVTPLVLNALFATLLLIVADGVLRSRSPPFSGRYRLAVLLGIIFLTPLPVAMFIGMEHTLHALLTILFLFLAARVVSDHPSSVVRRPSSVKKEPPINTDEHRYSDSESVSIGDHRWFQLFALLVLAPILTATRYEGLFLILATIVALAMRRRLALAIALLVLSLIPVFAYGLISHAHGWFWLPNTVPLKSPLIADLFRPGKLPGDIVSSVRYFNLEPELVFPLVLALVLFLARSRAEELLWDMNQILLGLFITANALHLVFVHPGWFGRYEIYLIAPGILILAIAAPEYLPAGLTTPHRGGPRRLAAGRSVRAVTSILLGLTVLLPYYSRLMLLHDLPRACTNIYEQPWQVGRFLKEFYPGRSVAIHDIGAINYEADIKCLDLYALASLDVARKTLEGVPVKEWFGDLAKSKDVKIAVVYRWAFVLDSPEVVSPPWIRVGNWTISRNVSNGDPIVSFFAADPSEADSLAMHLREFAPQLPRTVAQDGAYLR